MLSTQSSGGPVDLTVLVARGVERLKRSGELPSAVEICVFGPKFQSGSGDISDLHVEVSMSSKKDFAGAQAIARALRNFQPDVVHAQDRRASMLLALYRRNWAKLVTFHGVPDSATSKWVPQGRLGKRPIGLNGYNRLVADSLIANSMDLVVAPSIAIAGFLERSLRVPSSKVEVVHNGVEPGQSVGERSKAGGVSDFSKPGVVSDGDTASDGPIEHERPLTFVTVSSFAPCKEIPLLIDAFSDVVKVIPGAELLLVGDGEEKDLAVSKVNSMGLSTMVRFTGYTTGVRDYLRTSDVFVLPSSNENLPLAMLEAMSEGLPVIASNIGGIPEALDERSGILVTPNNRAQLVAAMVDLAGNYSKRLIMGDNAAARISDEFSSAKCAQGYLAAWNAVVSAKSKRKPALPGSKP